MHFNPRSPCGERLLSTLAILFKDRISIHAPRVGSDASLVRNSSMLKYISIHAPRVGSDNPYQASRSYPHYFNPRSPCGERPVGFTPTKLHIAFQSTLPVWGATNESKLESACMKFQSTLPVWGATRFQFCLPSAFAHFNPRSPCGERLEGEHKWTSESLFQSTLPVWGATRNEAACY